MVQYGISWFKWGNNSTIIVSHLFCQENIDFISSLEYLVQAYGIGTSVTRNQQSKPPSPIPKTPNCLIHFIQYYLTISTCPHSSPLYTGTKYWINKLTNDTILYIRNPKNDKIISSLVSMMIIYKHLPFGKNNQYLDVLICVNIKHNKYTILYQFQALLNNLLDELDIGMSFKGLTNMAYPITINKVLINIPLISYTPTPPHIQ